MILLRTHAAAGSKEGRNDHLIECSENSHRKGERFDVIGAVEFIAGEPSTRGKPIGLLSYCYGANTTFFAFEEDADFFVTAGVKALVALQPLSNGDYLKAMKLPNAIYEAAKAHYEASSGGYPFVAPIEDATKFVSVPTRLVQARKDPFTNLDKIEMMYEGIPTEKEMFWLEEPTTASMVTTGSAIIPETCWIGSSATWRSRHRNNRERRRTIRWPYRVSPSADGLARPASEVEAIND